MKKNCPLCRSKQTKLNGQYANGRQRFYCKECRHSFSIHNKGVKRSNEYIWFKEWLCEGYTVNQLSVAMDTPSLAIFGNTKIINWAPELFPGRICLHNPSHNSGKDDSFGISPDTAFDSAIKLLNPEDEIRKI
jgi:hypothetical protein